MVNRRIFLKIAVSPGKSFVLFTLNSAGNSQEMVKRAPTCGETRFFPMLLTAKQQLALRLQSRGIPQVEIARKLHVRPESICRLLSRAKLRMASIQRECNAEDRALLESVLN
jgi:DNA-binding NarL/FixJ family response regulator